MPEICGNPGEGLICLTEGGDVLLNRLFVDPHFDRVAIGDSDHLAAEYFDDLWRCGKDQPRNEQNGCGGGVTHGH